MAKLAPTSTKYVIKALIKANGVIEKPDVIGAIFGQTEGLLGSDLDLRELQRTGRIGRIEVKIKSQEGKSEGEIIIPSSLDAAETSLIAATLETIERVGPCTAEIKLTEVEDTRSVKRQYVVDKAKEILKTMSEAGMPDTEEISEQIKEAVRTDEITDYEGLPAGPNLLESESIIVVEGRADVLNLLRHGIRNTIAIEGTSIPESVVRLAKEKSITLFVDGDRGGKLIAKELMQRTDIDFVAQAPEGKEVEECTKKEIFKALREKVTGEQFIAEVKNSNGPPVKTEHATRSYPPRAYHGRAGYPSHERRFERREDFRKFPELPKAKLKPKERDVFKKTLDELVGTRAACIFDEGLQMLGKVPIAELMNTIKTVEKPYAVVFDGIVDFRMNSLAKMKGIKFLIGMEKEQMSSPVTILSRNDLEK